MYCTSYFPSFSLYHLRFHHTGSAFLCLNQVVYDLVKHKFAAPNQVATIYDMKERVEDGKSYYTFEYGLRTPIYATTCFATVAVGNNRYYTLIVGANERRWRKVKKQLEVVADSLKILQI